MREILCRAVPRPTVSEIQFQLLGNQANLNIFLLLLKVRADNELIIQNTLQPLYNTVRYNTVLDITRFKDGSQKCIDYIEK